MDIYVYVKSNQLYSKPQIHSVNWLFKFAFFWQKENDLVNNCLFDFNVKKEHFRCILLYYFWKNKQNEKLSNVQRRNLQTELIY